MADRLRRVARHALLSLHPTTRSVLDREGREEYSSSLLFLSIFRCIIHEPEVGFDYTHALFVTGGA